MVRLGLTLGLIRAMVTVWVKFKVGVRARIAFFCLHDGMQISYVSNDMVYWLEITLGLKFYNYPSLEFDQYQDRAGLSNWLCVVGKILA